MKKIYKYLLITVLAMGTVFYSCETIELENLTSPNALSPDQADANALLNSIQRAYRASQITFNDRSGELTRIDYMGSRDYFSAYPSATLNGPWQNLYSSMLPDIAAIEALNEDPNIDLSFHIGISKAMQGHLMMQLVDFLGDIVWSQANNPIEYPSPMLDDDADVYAAAIGILNEAANALSGVDDAPSGVQDLYTDGDVDIWKKFINTVLMRANLTTGQNSAVLSASNVIDSNDDNFFFPYGTNVLSPDNRHPDYATDYTDSGANIYQSNWLMGLMDSTDDPRTRYYFYRQSDCTPGASCDSDGNGETLSCSLESIPVHYATGGFTFCYLENGYWGRDHGDDDGTPPDNFLRSAVGVYPAAGRFDDNAFSNVGLGVGGGGAGIEPIYSASFVDFMRAEAALATSQNDLALDYILSGIQKSIDHVQTFAAVDGSADLSYEPSGDDISGFIDDVETAFNAADSDGKWNILGEQYFVAMYGGAADAYNFYRRTGFPTTLTPNLEPVPGVFPRTLLYPNNEVIANPNITQRLDNNTQVFWDTNPPGPAFPPSN
jgi:hypothetical protein